MATDWTLGGVARDPHRQAAFWCAALGYVPEPGYDDPDGTSIVDPEGRLPVMGWLRTDRDPTPRDRHVDIRVAGEGPRDAASEQRIRAKVAELVALGASVVREDRYGPELGHVVLHDPEGNEFCVG